MAVIVRGVWFLRSKVKAAAYAGWSGAGASVVVEPVTVKGAKKWLSKLVGLEVDIEYAVADSAGRRRAYTSMHLAAADILSLIGEHGASCEVSVSPGDTFVRALDVFPEPFSASQLLRLETQKQKLFAEEMRLSNSVDAADGMQNGNAAQRAAYADLLSRQEVFSEEAFALSVVLEPYGK